MTMSDPGPIDGLIDVYQSRALPGVSEAIRRILDGAPYLDVLAELAGHPITGEVVGPYHPLTGVNIREFIRSAADEHEDAGRYAKARATLTPEALGWDASVILFGRWIKAFERHHGITATAVAHLAPLDEAAQQAFRLHPNRNDRRRMDEREWPPGCYLTATTESGLDPSTVATELGDLAELLTIQETQVGRPPWERTDFGPDHPADLAVERLVAAALALIEAGMRGEQAVQTALEDIYRRYEADLDLVVRDAADRADTATVAGLVPLVDDTDDLPVWVIDELLVRGEVALLAAPAFSGKTPFAIDLACAVATGRDVLGRAVKQGRVLFVSREEPAREVRRWLRRLGHDLTALRPNLLVLVRPDWPDLATAAGGAALLQVLVDHGPFVLVVIDTLGRFVRGTENASETYGLLHEHTIDVLRGLGPDAPALLALDHLSGENSLRPRGSTAKGDVVDTVWLLKRTRGARDDDVTRHRLSHRGFVRLPRPSPVWFERVYDEAGNCMFRPIGAGADDTADQLDEDIETTIEEAVLAAMPVDSMRQLEGVLRVQLGDSFRRNEVRRVVNQLVATDQVEAFQVGKNRATGFRAK
jgi:hypothetical protein